MSKYLVWYQWVVKRVRGRSYRYLVRRWAVRERYESGRRRVKQAAVPRTHWPKRTRRKRNDFVSNMLRTATVGKIKTWDFWEENIITPLEEKSWPGKDDWAEDALVVGFDAEDVSEERVIKSPSGRKILCQVPDLLGLSFATIRQDGKLDTTTWDPEGPITWSELESFVRRWLKEPTRHIYLLSYWSYAELRHVKDFKRAIKKNETINIHDDSLHIQTRSMTLIDALPYFSMKLEKLAPLVGLKKVQLSKKQLAHMDLLKKQNPTLFWERCVEDSKILVLAYQKLRRFIYERYNIEILPRKPGQFTVPTLASFAMRLFRTRFLSAPSMKWVVRRTLRTRRVVSKKTREESWREEVEKSKVLDPSLLNVRWAACRAAWGGLRLAAGCGLYDGPTTCLDFSGHYSQCGIDQALPTAETEWIHYTGKEHLDEILKCEGFVRLVNACDLNPYPYIPSFCKRLMCPVRVNETPGVDPEWVGIQSFRESYRSGKLTFDDIEAYCFDPSKTATEPGVRSFLTHFRKLKDEAELRCKEEGRNKNEDWEYVMFKLIGNSLIGKFWQGVEDDEETLCEFFGLTRHDIRREDERARKGRPEPKHKTLANFFAVEWAALILDRARAALNLALNLSNGITCHTDSVVFPSNPEVESKVREGLKEYGTFDEKFRAKGLWILRSSVYIALDKDQSGKWIPLEDEFGKTTLHAHHGISVDSDEMFLNPVVDALNTGVWSNPTMRKSSLATITTETTRKIPIGASYIRTQQVKLQWDFKRVLPNDFDVERDCFTKWSGRCGPYETVGKAWQDERLFEREKRKRTRLKKRRGPKRKWKSEAERLRAYRARHKQFRTDR